MKRGAVAFTANWNPLPRKPRLVDVKGKQHVDVVREFLRERGLRDPIVHISQIVSVDLDGDGQDEFLISATHYKDSDEIPDESTANTYSFVMVERKVGSKPKAELVTVSFTQKRKVTPRRISSRLRRCSISMATARSRSWCVPPTTKATRSPFTKRNRRASKKR